MSESTPQPPELPAKPARRGRTLAIAAGAVVVVAALVWGLVATLGKDDASAAGPVKVRLGTTDVSQPHWKILKELAAKENIDLEIVGFSEYTQPNPALKQKQIDLNAFQHILYLADHNNHTGDDLQPIGSTLIVPLPLYSHKYTKVDEFKKGDEVAIPSDATNQARALFVLKGAGLISFAGDPKVPTPDDIDKAASTVVVRPVDASQTATLIDQLAGVVVNNNFATDAGFDLKSYVYADDPASAGAQPYINVIAARPEDVDNPTYLTIVKLYHDPAVLKSVVDSSGGTAVIVDGYDGAKLREVLKQTEANLKAAG